MNKLAIMAGGLLLICSVLLWGLAPGSFNQYIQQQVEQLSSAVSQQQITVGHVHVHTEQGLSILKNINIVDHAGNTLASIKELSAAVNPQSLNSATIIINQIDIEQLQINSPSDIIINTLINAVKQHISLAASNSQPKLTSNDISFIVKRIEIHQLKRVNNNKAEQITDKLIIKSINNDLGMDKTQLTQQLFLSILQSVKPRL